MGELAQELITKTMTVAAYDPFRAQLAELKEGNSKAVFDYRSPKGNKEARSHIFKLRQTKGAVERVRKAEKEESLNYGRLIDAQAKEIVCEIEAMIEVHEAPIRQIEEEEAARIAGHQSRIQEIKSFINPDWACMSSDSLNDSLHELELLEPDESFEEFTAEAITAFKQANEYLLGLHAASAKREHDQAELESLRKAQVEREQKEREEKLLREASAKAEADKQAAVQAEKDKAERARIEAEQKAERDRLAAENARLAAEAKQKAEVAKLEREKIEAQQRADNAAKAAREKIRLEQEAQAAESARREANVQHKRKINQEALADLIRICKLSDQQAKDVVSAIAKSEIAHIKISY